MARASILAGRAGRGFLVKMAGRLFRRTRSAARRTEQRYVPHSGANVADGVRAGGVRYTAKHLDDWDREGIKIYNKILKNTGDTARISANTGIPKRELDRIKKHFFEDEHTVAVGPNEYVTGRFLPQPNMGQLWQKAEKGTLTSKEADEFRRWMAHEGIESRLMTQRGMPYISGNPRNWTPDPPGYRYDAHPGSYGAHDLAPNANPRSTPFGHYDSLGLPQPTTPPNRNLDNLDDVFDSIP